MITLLHTLRILYESLSDRAALCSLGLIAVVFVVDICLPLGVASAVPYTFAVLLALASRIRRLALCVAFLCCVLTVAKVIFFPERGSTEWWKVIANRGLALVSIGMTTFLGLKRRRSEEHRLLAEEQTRLHLADLAHMGRLKTAGQLAASLAHELNQPLAAVCLQAEVAAQLARLNRDPQVLHQALQEVLEQSRRAAAIVRTLRGLVQKAEPRYLAVDIVAVLRAVARLIEPQARLANVTLQLRLPENLPPVLGDHIQLEQVLLNLLQNALDAICAAQTGLRSVVVEAQTNEVEQVVVSVTDTGIGLGSDEVEQVFERFYSTKPNGMGMGLAISRSIVEAHGGRLWGRPVSSDTQSVLGRGAVFVFTLPVIKNTTPAVPVAPVALVVPSVVASVPTPALTRK